MLVVVVMMLLLLVNIFTYKIFIIEMLAAILWIAIKSKFKPNDYGHRL